MDIDSVEIPDWVSRKIAESQQITKDLAKEEPMIF
jgi:hypothetical protein